MGKERSVDDSADSSLGRKGGQAREGAGQKTGLMGRGGGGAEKTLENHGSQLVGRDPVANFNDLLSGVTKDHRTT